jgi:hypothetical protein
MDVAAFVGFAASGPLHTPVAVEDVAGFEAVFGPPPVLAWDAQRGEPVQAYLAVAVRAFFRNGGRRCWVVRVAGPDARSNVFPVPGLARFSATGKVSPAFAPARSEGSWSDGLQVAATLTRELLAVRGWTVIGDGAALTVEVPGGVAVGDLLRIPFVTEPDAGPGREPYALLVPVQESRAVEYIEGAPASGAIRRPASRVSAARVVWLEQNAGPGSAPTTPLQVRWDRGDGERSAAVTQVKDPGPDARPRVLSLELDVSPAEAPPPGTVLTLEDGDGTRWLLAVDTLQSPEGTSLVDGSAQVSGTAVRVLPSAPPATLFPRGCERLTFTLWTRRGEEPQARLDGLGFSARHPRAWAALPTDLERARWQDPEALSDESPWKAWLEDARQVVSGPRFPLAGPDLEDGVFFFPVGMDELPSRYLGCPPPSEDALVRDGLEAFGSDLFLDADLLAIGTEGLMAQADFLRYQSSQPRALRGIHALLAQSDVTLLAVPDAVHRRWSRSSGDEAPEPVPPVVPPEPDRSTFGPCEVRRLRAPALLHAEPVTPAAEQAFTLRWCVFPPEPPDVAYTLEEATFPDYRDAKVLYRGPSTQRVLHGRGPGSWYYRVRAESGEVVSLWSPGLVLAIAPEVRWQVEPEADFTPDTLLAVQRALLRMCCARGDLLAVLALPEHYREDAALAHVEKLQSPLAGGTEDVPAIGFAEENALSYGALYHPWTWASDTDGPDQLQRVPPDGSACGVMARRALERGAWLAPANEPWLGVVALTPSLPRERWAELLDAQVNLVTQEPRAFLTLAADTLALDPELRPINVRRLLILLRRAALRLGATYVFEPNDPSFHRLVQRGFEALLGDLFGRGAFAGRTRESAFQVVTGGALNTPTTMEQGRFYVDLRVAPSIPLSFLNVRLVQSGDRGLVTEER